MSSSAYWCKAWSRAESGERQPMRGLLIMATSPEDAREVYAKMASVKEAWWKTNWPSPRVVIRVVRADRFQEEDCR